MQELAASIHENGVLQPLLVRPCAERLNRFRRTPVSRRGVGEKETVPGIRRRRRAGAGAQLVENLQRPRTCIRMRPQGFAALLRLEEPKYSMNSCGQMRKASGPVTPPPA